MATAKWVDISVPTARIYEVSDIIRGLETHSLVVADTGATEEGDNVRGFDAHSMSRSDTGVAAEGKNARGLDAHSLARADTGTSEEGANANGMESHVLVKADAGTSEEGENASGLESHSPVKADTGQAAHLKPDHRWQMPLPRNLLDDPESFDPASTAWATTTGATYAGTVANVGPNGETAAQIDFDGTADAGLVQSLSLSSHSPFTQGFYVRAVSGTQDVMPSHTDGGTVEDGSIVTVSTDWQWVDPTITPAGTLDQIGLRSDVAGSIYVLRANLNRGSAREYSTRSSVPQVINDVIAGGDVDSGTDQTAESSDLDFAVDGLGVPYSVSDGTGQTSNVPASATGNGTWAASVYLPAQANLSGVQTILGQQADGLALQWDEGNGRFQLILEDSGGGTKTTTVSPSTPYSSWHHIAFTIESGQARLNVGGTTSTVDLSSFTPLGNQHPLVNAQASGMRVQWPERHPVLSAQEEEAVRQRLANNPSDPVVPTEAWDLTAETSPHNLVTQSEDISSADWTKTNATVTADATNDPNGNATADALIEDSSTAQHFIQQAGPTLAAGAQYVFPIWIQDNGRTWAKIALSGAAFTTNPEAWVDLSGNAIGTTTAVDSADVTEVGGGWHRAWILVTADNADASNIEVYIADADGSDSYAGDGASGLYVWGAQFVRGDDTPPPYVATTTSIAFPQTVPAKRDATNDLTLGSTSSADTNDPDWVAPIGVVGDGDDSLTIPGRLFSGGQSTVLLGIKDISGSGFLIIGDDTGDNPWELLIDNDPHRARLRVFSISGGALGGTYTSVPHDTLDGSLHVWSVTVGEDQAKLGADGVTLQTFSIDGMIKDGGLEVLENGWDGRALTHAHAYTRALTDEEALYARRRILDNPQSAFPNYTTP